MQGAWDLPCSKRSRTRLAPTPTNISTKSEPDMEKKGRPASPATALASRVLPVPGGPTRSAPLGSRPPSRVNFCGSLRNSMISCSSTLASSAPATSAKVTFGVSPASSLALDFPNAKARLPPAWSCRSRKNQRPRITIQGSAAMMIAVMPPLGSLARMGTPASSSRLMKVSLFATGRSTVKLLAVRPSWVTGARKSPSRRLPSNTSTRAMLPWSSCRLNSV